MFLKCFLLTNFFSSTLGGSTKGQTIADWLGTSLDLHVDGDLSAGSSMVSVYTGNQPHIPLSTHLVDTTGKPAFHSTTQQALYGVHRK